MTLGIVSSVQVASTVTRLALLLLLRRVILATTVHKVTLYNCKLRGDRAAKKMSNPGYFCLQLTLQGALFYETQTSWPQLYVIDLVEL